MSQLRDYFPTTPVWTPEIGRGGAVAARWIANGLRGGCFWGVQNSGKSSFGDYLKSALPTVLSDGIAVALWSFSLAPRKVDEVLQRALLGCGCTAISASKTNVLQARLLAHIEQLCERSRTRRFVAIIDEIQRLKTDYYPVLQSITDDLSQRGITPFVLSIGQPEMEDAVRLLHTEGHLNLIGRFFNNVESFRGLTVAEAVEMLANLDGAGGEFTRRWFPSRADTGWRLKDMGKSLGAALDLLKTERNLNARPLLPMGYLRPSLNSLFGQLSVDEQAVLGDDGVLMKLHFDEVKFSTICHYYVPPQELTKAA